MENTQYQPQDPQSAPEAAMPKTAMGITSLVLGIIAIVSSWMPIVNNLSALLALLGGIFGVIGVVAVIRGKKSGKVLAIVGLVLNVVALVVVLATQSIYDQLTSEYGEQFSAEAAQYAIDNVVADWNANALEKAKSYEEMMNMSPAAIHDQLTSEYGEKFTEEEADYAIANM